MPYKFENLNINEVIEAAVTLLAYHKVSSTDIIIEKDLAKDLPFVRGDFKQLQEALLELFLNACQAMTGGNKLIIKTSILENHYIEVKITTPSLFKEKQRIDFDLLLCYKIINNLNGSIEIENQKDYGATVLIRLPRA